MPHVGLTSALFTDFTTRPKSLQVGSLEVLKQAGTPGNLYGVAIDSISLTHAVPGQVSSLSFTIDDPANALTMPDGVLVKFWDLTRDAALFLGFIDSWEPTPFGTGRSIAVECKGVEAVLDWLYVPNAISWTAGQSLIDVIQSAVAQSSGIGFPLRDFNLPGSGSSIANPVGFAFGAGPKMVAAGTAGPGSLRDVLQTACDSTDGSLAGGTVQYASFAVTVDFYGGLRLIGTTLGVAATDVTDAGGFTISTSGAPFATGLKHKTIPGDATRGVYLTGGNAAGSGAFSDGSGIVGPWAQISDSNSLTADYAKRVALSYLARHGLTIAGEFDVEDQASGEPNIGSTNLQRLPGMSQLQITDVNLGLLAYAVVIGEISKTFLPSGKEQWHVTYGTTQSGAAYLRQLTRSRIE